jgi:hypothetical protein
MLCVSCYTVAVGGQFGNCVGNCVGLVLRGLLGGLEFGGRCDVEQFGMGNGRVDLEVRVCGDRKGVSVHAIQACGEVQV